MVASKSACDWKQFHSSHLYWPCARQCAVQPLYRVYGVLLTVCTEPEGNMCIHLTESCSMNDVHLLPEILCRTDCYRLWHSPEVIVFFKLFVELSQNVTRHCLDRLAPLNKRCACMRVSHWKCDTLYSKFLAIRRFDWCSVNMIGIRTAGYRPGIGAKLIYCMQETIFFLMIDFAVLEMFISVVHKNGSQKNSLYLYS